MTVLTKDVQEFVFRSATFMGRFDEERHSQHLWCECRGGEDQPKLESPIEQLLWVALRAVAYTNFITLFHPIFEVNGKPCLPIGIYLTPQFRAGTYRLDFALEEYKEVRNSADVHPATKWAIECDGHDFHERTKVQASWDKQRDRWLTAHGWKILHYTGSDIVRDPYSAAVEILTLVTTDNLIVNPIDAYPDISDES